MINSTASVATPLEGAGPRTVTGGQGSPAGPSDAELGWLTFLDAGLLALEASGRPQDGKPGAASEPKHGVVEPGQLVGWPDGFSPLAFLGAESIQSPSPDRQEPVTNEGTDDEVLLSQSGMIAPLVALASQAERNEPGSVASLISNRPMVMPSGCDALSAELGPSNHGDAFQDGPDAVAKLAEWARLRIRTMETHFAVASPGPAGLSGVERPGELELKTLLVRFSDGAAALRGTPAGSDIDAHVQTSAGAVITIGRMPDVRAKSELPANAVALSGNKVTKAGTVADVVPIAATKELRDPWASAATPAAALESAISDHATIGGSVVAQLVRGISTGSTHSTLIDAARTGSASAAFAPAKEAAPGPVRVVMIELHPEDLGRVEVRMRLSEGRLELKFRAEREATQSIIDERFGELGERLADAGFVLEGASVGKLFEPLDGGSEVPKSSAERDGAGVAPGHQGDAGADRRRPEARPRNELRSDAEPVNNASPAGTTRAAGLFV